MAHNATLLITNAWTFGLQLWLSHPPLGKQSLFHSISESRQETAHHTRIKDNKFSSVGTIVHIVLDKLYGKGKLSMNGESRKEIDLEVILKKEEKR